MNTIYPCFFPFESLVELHILSLMGQVMWLVLMTQWRVKVTCVISRSEHLIACLILTEVSSFSDTAISDVQNGYFIP